MRILATIGRLWYLAKLGALSLLPTKPWRKRAPRDDPAGLEYVELVVGPDGADAPLPMLVLLHGFGSQPEALRTVALKLGIGVRVILPAAPIRHALGSSWFTGTNRGVAAEQARRSATSLVSLVSALTAERPTIGRPVVAGIAQGGTICHSLVLYRPDFFAASFPLAGECVERVPSKLHGGAKTTVRAFHSVGDPVTSVRSARAAIERLRAAGIDAELNEWLGFGDQAGSEMVEAWCAGVRDALLRETIVSFRIETRAAVGSAQ